jgi:hypothetical protein
MRTTSYTLARPGNWLIGSGSAQSQVVHVPDCQPPGRTPRRLRYASRRRCVHRSGILRRQRCLRRCCRRSRSRYSRARARLRSRWPLARHSGRRRESAERRSHCPGTATVAFDQVVHDGAAQRQRNANHSAGSLSNPSVPRAATTSAAATVLALVVTSAFPFLAVLRPGVLPAPGPPAPWLMRPTDLEGQMRSSMPIKHSWKHQADHFTKPQDVPTQVNDSEVPHSK